MGALYCATDAQGEPARPATAAHDTPCRTGSGRAVAGPWPGPADRAAKKMVVRRTRAAHAWPALYARDEAVRGPPLVTLQNPGAERGLLRTPLA